MTTVIGAGVAGLSIATALAQRGWSVQLIDGGAGAVGPVWGVVPAGFGRGLPAGCCRDESLPFDLILPGEHRVGTAGRVTLVDLGRLRAAWRRHAGDAGVAVCPDRVAGPLRCDGGVVGVRLEGGERSAPLTIDASGEGVLLPWLPGAALPGGRWPRDQREPWAFAQLRVRPQHAQTAWVGRAQLRLDLDGPGALGWRCAPRDGTAVWAAATAGRGTTRSAAREVLAQVVAPLALDTAEVVVRWVPSRRPLDTISSAGLVVIGAAVAWNDALLGISLPSLQIAVEIVARALDPVRDGARPEPSTLHAGSAAVLRGPGGAWAVRSSCRRLLDGLGPAGREGLVTAGVVGPLDWGAALQGVGLVGLSGAARAAASRLPRPWLRRVWGEAVRGKRLRAHALVYPQRFDRFEIDRWQARQQHLSGEG